MMTAIAAQAPPELNDQQRAAYVELIDFVQGDHGESIFLLEGYAGTGKTYLIGKFLEWLHATRPKWGIAMTAPTNKAVKVLRRSAKVGKCQAVNFSTIHSLLGLREQITDSGDQIFVSGNGEPNNLLNNKVLILDEVSMLCDDLFLRIQAHAMSVKIILLGDPCQIPPVMKHECIPFTEAGQYEYSIQKHQLTEIMRQKKGNSIIETSFLIRENLGLDRLPIIREDQVGEDGKGVLHMDTGNPEVREAFLKLLSDHFASEAFRLDSDHAKVISWTNKSVWQMNDLIRGMIYADDKAAGLGKLPKIMIGEKLLANKPIIEIDPKLGKVILFTSNEEFEVKSYEVLTDDRFFFYYSTIVEYALINGQKETKKIKILHEDSSAEFNKKLNEIKRGATNEKDLVRRRSEWRYYYDFLGSFANVAYNYAITAHKSQGSSYRNTFVLEDDIDRNRKAIERNRIKYTACTRATDRLYLIKRA